MSDAGSNGFGGLMLHLRPSIVKEAVFVGTVWGCMGVSFLFVAARLAIRWKTFRKLWADDLFVVIGWVLILASAIVWNFAHRQMYLSSKVTSGELSPLDYPDIIPDGEHYLRSSAVILILFYSSLAAIKMSFLMFFQRLLAGVGNRRLQIQWWVVFGFVITTWVACIADNPYECLTPSFIDIAIVCSRLSEVQRIRTIYIANCVLDVVTDLLILTIPVAILWNIRIPMKHRLALMGLFGLTIATITIAIVRVAVVLHASTETNQFDVSWLYTWSAIEPAVAVITSCLVSFRTLFKRNEARPRPAGAYLRTENLTSFSDRWRRLIGRKKTQSDVRMKDLSSSGKTQNSTPINASAVRTESSEQMFNGEERMYPPLQHDEIWEAPPTVAIQFEGIRGQPTNYRRA